MPSNATDCPMLLTATIHIHEGQIGEHADASTRTQQYVQVLEWLANGVCDIKDVVLCDNSGADLSAFAETKRLYERVGKRLELLEACVPADVRLPGKGWGEGWTIRHALLHSTLLVGAPAFYKLTGRYKLPNLLPILRCIQRSAAVEFLCPDLRTSTRGPYASTAFFWSTTDFYRKHLMDAFEEVDDQAGVYIEHVHGRRLVEAAKSAPVGLLPFAPLYDGISGHSGRRLYSTGQRLRIHFDTLLRSRAPLHRLEVTA